MGPNLLKAFKIIFIFSLLVLGLYSSVITGFSWDEYFHHINGNVRFQFYATLGAVDRLDFVVRSADNVHCVVTLDVK